MQLIPEPFGSPEVTRLVEAQQAEVLARGDSGDIDPPREPELFEPPRGIFILARDDAGLAVGCGGVCRRDADRAELKRLYVVPHARGRGVGRRLLERLEAEARLLGCTTVVLETVDLMHEAIALYTASGFEPIPRYGAYSHSADSRCFEKRL